MLIAALYDIHGNSDALAAVLAEDDVAGADLVIVGGDTAPGPFAARALAQLDALADRVPVRWVRGNGEREAGEAAGAPEPVLTDPSQMPLLTAWLSAREVGSERARRLGALPLTVTVDGILFCHASPARDDEMLTRLTPEADWAAALEGLADASSLIVAGHTHQQDDRMAGPVRFVNAGSIGLPYEGDGAARWLSIRDGVPSLRRTAYDAAAAGRRMLDAGWPDSDSVTAALIEPMPAIEITELFEASRRAVP